MTDIIKLVIRSGTNERIANVSPAGWDLKAYDANRSEVPFEPAIFAKDTSLAQTLVSNQWAYHLYCKAFNAPITLRVTQMSLEFKQPVKITLDLRPYNFSFSEDQIGIPWKFGLNPLDIPAIQASAFKATYVKENNLRGFEIGIQADPVMALVKPDTCQIIPLPLNNWFPAWIP